MKKKIGSSKSIKKMEIGGTPSSTPIRKGSSGSGITGVRAAVFNQAKSDWGEKPSTQWSQDQMSNWKKSVASKPNYKKGGSVGKPKMKMGGSTKRKKC